MDADALMLASPVYVGGITSQLKAFIDRASTVSQIMIVSSSYWNMGIGRNPGEVMNDLEGIQV